MPRVLLCWVSVVLFFLARGEAFGVAPTHPLLSVSSRCTKYSFPEHQSTFLSNVVIFLEGKPEKGSATFCTGDERAISDDLDVVKKTVVQLYAQVDQIKRESKAWRDEDERRSNPPRDCVDHQRNGATISGIYHIYPLGCLCQPPVKVFCDMDTTAGGWTVILALMNQTTNSSIPDYDQNINQLDFHRDWKDYSRGFGEPGSEYWLGNEVLYRLTSGMKYRIRLEAKTYNGGDHWAEWNNFEVASESNRYKMKVEGYNEESSEPDYLLSYHNNMEFSTFDQDNDKDGGNCAQSLKGGWWYNKCFSINPTGLHGDKSGKGIKILYNRNTPEAWVEHAHWLQIKIRQLN